MPKERAKRDDPFMQRRWREVAGGPPARDELVGFVDGDFLEGEAAERQREIFRYVFRRRVRGDGRLALAVGLDELAGAREARIFFAEPLFSFMRF